MYVLLKSKLQVFQCLVVGHHHVIDPEREVSLEVMFVWLADV